jgi:hypothetical protein
MHLTTVLHLRGALGNNVCFKGQLYASSQKCSLGRSPIYSQRWILYVLITTMFFQEVNLSSKGNFQYKSYNKKGSAYVIEYVHPSIQHAWGALQLVEYTSSCKLYDFANSNIFRNLTFQEHKERKYRNPNCLSLPYTSLFTHFTCTCFVSIQ